MSAKFITFEGIEGVGKTSNIGFFTQKLTDNQIDWKITREPGGTPMAESIREVLLADYKEKVHPVTETLLFYAGRIQHVENVIKPNLEDDTWVLCDRFFDATIAYQGGGRNVDMTRLKALNDWALDGFKPDYTILFDAPAEVGLSRIKNRGALDRIEKEQVEFFERIRQAYLQMAKDEPARFRVLDATKPLDSVQSDLSAIIDEIING